MRPYSFPRHHRLLEPHQFQAVFNHPDYRASQSCFLLLARENQLDYPRLGLVVGRRKARKAVDRNRVKRIGRETFRIQTRELTGLDIVVLLRRPPESADAAYLRRELDQAWQRLLAKRDQA